MAGGTHWVVPAGGLLCPAAPPAASSTVPKLLWAGLQGEQGGAGHPLLLPRPPRLTVLLPQVVKSQRRVYLQTVQDFQRRDKSTLACPSCRLPQLSKPGSGSGELSLLLERRGGLAKTNHGGQREKREMEFFLGWWFSLPLQVIEDGQ